MKKTIAQEKKMTEPSMKQVWAGMAMMALLSRPNFEGTYQDVAIDAWDMAERMEVEQQERDD
jgi:hypothetical protein